MSTNIWETLYLKAFIYSLEVRIYKIELIWNVISGILLV